MERKRRRGRDGEWKKGSEKGEKEGNERKWEDGRDRGKSGREVYI